MLVMQTRLNEGLVNAYIEEPHRHIKSVINQMHKIAEARAMPYAEFLEWVAAEMVAQLRREKAARFLQAHSVQPSTKFGFNHASDEFWDMLPLVRANENYHLIETSLFGRLNGSLVIDLGCGSRHSVEGVAKYLAEEYGIAEYIGVDPNHIKDEAWELKLDDIGAIVRVETRGQDALSYLVNSKAEGHVLANGFLCTVLQEDVELAQSNHVGIMYEAGLIEMISERVGFGNLVFGTEISQRYQKLLKKMGFYLSFWDETTGFIMLREVK